MAIETRRTSDEFVETTEYIRRLCEGESVEHPSLRSMDGHEGMQGSGHTNGSIEASATADGSHATTPTPSYLATPPAPKTAPTTPGSAAVAAMDTPTKPGSRQCTNGTHDSASRPSRPKKQANGAAGGPQSEKTHDTCDACGQPGQFICCDSCPRVFHFLCAEPPIAYETVGTIDHWFCRECAHLATRRRKSRAHAKNIFYPLISDMEFKNPRAFSVPEDIRRQFDGIEADVDGTFVNTREDRPQRANAGPANRDFTRLVDDHNEPILCYRCGLSALHGLVVRCDYCPLNWHWDCLDPPLSAAPPPHKKWMCPNHADHAMHRHHKFRKERVVDLSDSPANARNSGVIEIIDDDPPPSQELFDPKVKYRLPSSHIRQIFGSRASGCRGALEKKRGIVQNNDLSSASASETPSSAADPRQDGEQPSMSVAEWLQSIVTFQQDVARFIMTTAKQTVAQGASGEAGSDSHGDAEPADGESSKSQEDRLALLSTTAASILTPLISRSGDAYTAAATTTNFPPEPPASTAVADGSGGGPDANKGMCVSNQAMRSRRSRILAEHGLADSDMLEAVRQVLSRSTRHPDGLCACKLETGSNGGPGNKAGQAESGNKRKCRAGTPTVGGCVDDGVSKRLRPAPVELEEAQRHDEHDSSPAAAEDGAAAATASKQAPGAGAVDTGNNSSQVSRAKDLVSTLLSAKGTTALLDFLLSE